ncbi:MAG: hypothetical protein DIZ78_06340 [endosymbiont of Escarpia spicata]|uniref:TIR domain-containing protein n=1 Tax=endosymbiont of Escarpia spicata TaxID=2200908 RepID=A0A370DQ82_9GAMM|nr:MAG: hypothetical protein DIZ78_06340 [endosymbiont of Escarpia spicata]
MSKIFVSYRQQGTLMRAGRIADTLISHFGAGNIFQDQATLHGGSDWQQAIDKALKDCSVLVAVIGPHWLEHKSANGGRRIDEPDDYVLLEIATALNRDIPVIPVLVGGTKRFHLEELPDPLKKLAYIEPLSIEDSAWHAGMHSLLESIRRFDINPKKIGWKTFTSLALSVIGMFAIGSDDVSLEAAIVGLVLGLLALVLSLRSYYEFRKGTQRGRSWAVGAIIYSGLIALVALDEMIPDKYF